MKLGFKTMPQNIEWPVMLETWRELDADPRYESAWLFDHFYPIYGSEEGPCLEAWVALSALAQATDRIRIGTMVNAAPYRNPGLFADMASTLDVISNGRLDLGLGAGWNESEASAYGIELGTITERFDRFEEYLECVVSLLSQPVTNFQGRYYTLTDARNEPKGPQQPTPPIVIGGAGPRRTMPLVARSGPTTGTSPAARSPSSPRSRPGWPNAAKRSAATPPRSPPHPTSSTEPTTPSKTSSPKPSNIKEAGLDLAILYPFSPINPTSVHEMADALEPLIRK